MIRDLVFEKKKKNGCIRKVDKTSFAEKFDNYGNPKNFKGLT